VGSLAKDYARVAVGIWAPVTNATRLESKRSRGAFFILLSTLKVTLTGWGGNTMAARGLSGAQHLLTTSHESISFTEAKNWTVGRKQEGKREEYGPEQCLLSAERKGGTSGVQERISSGPHSVSPR